MHGAMINIAPQQSPSLKDATLCESASRVRNVNIRVLDTDNFYCRVHSIETVAKRTYACTVGADSSRIHIHIATAVKGLNRSERTGANRERIAGLLDAPFSQRPIATERMCLISGFERNS